MPGQKFTTLPDGSFVPAFAMYDSGGSESGLALNPYKVVSASGTNANLVSSAAKRLGFIAAYNINAAPRYLKVYDKATAPTVGTDVPVLTMMIPGSSTNGAGSNIAFPDSIKITNGLGIGITGGIGDLDATAIAANEVVVNLGWS